MSPINNFRQGLKKVQEEILHRLRPESIAIHYGYLPQLSEGSAIPPVFDSTTYIAKSAQELERKFIHLRSGRKGELVYSRLGQPNTQILEERYAATFYGSTLSEPESLLTCSGMEALALTFDAYLRPGDLVLYNEPLYGGTFGHLKWLEKRYGICLQSFKNADDLAEMNPSDALKLIFLESPTNPTLEEVDIEACAAFAARHTSMRSDNLQTLLVVDNTFMTPYLQQPLSCGAHIEVHSATKYLGGHGDLVAGVIFGNKKYIAPIRALRSQRGGTIDARRVVRLAKSLETLAMRMQRHCANATQVALFLSKHPNVVNLRFLGMLPEHSEQFRIHHKQSCGTSGMISFEVKGGLKATRKFLNKLRMIMLAVSLGATHSLACHPAVTTHSGIPAAERKRMGIPNNLIRLSVGTEHYADIIADIEQALDSA